MGLIVQVIVENVVTVMFFSDIQCISTPQGFVLGPLLF